MNKRWLQLLIVIILSILQISLAKSFGLVSGNFLLAYFLVASLYFDYTLLIWLALLSGVLLDLYGVPSSFGLNIGFLLLVVIISKLVIRIENQTQRLWYCLLLSTGFSLVFFAAEVALVVNVFERSAVLPLLWKLVGTIVYNGLLVIIMFAIFEFVGNRRSRQLGKR